VQFRPPQLHGALGEDVSEICPKRDIADRKRRIAFPMLPKPFFYSIYFGQIDSREHLEEVPAA
jgi:hypothetical protein